MMGAEGLEPIGMKASLLKFIPTVESADSCRVQKSAHTLKEDYSGSRKQPNGTHGAHEIHQAHPFLLKIVTFTIHRIYKRFDDHS